MKVKLFYFTEDENGHVIFRWARKYYWFRMGNDIFSKSQGKSVYKEIVCPFGIEF